MWIFAVRFDLKGFVAVVVRITALATEEKAVSITLLADDTQRDL